MVYNFKKIKSTKKFFNDSVASNVRQDDLYWVIISYRLLESKF